MRPYQFQPPLTERLAPRTGVGHRAGLPGILAGVVTALVAGSGILNLISLQGGSGGALQPYWLRDLFPLEFVGISRTLTLLSGYALILTSVHLASHKRRAWQLALLLSTASVLFHLTKGWDIAEAACSGLVAVLLWRTARCFTLGASKPRFGTAALRATAAFMIAAGYGAVGFWCLEPAEFHHNFHWAEAALRSVQLMLYLGDTTLVPHTPYAVWFLDSLYSLSAAAFLYSGFVLFRPVAYRFRVSWRESALAERIAVQYGQTAQDYFKHSPDKSYFFSSSGEAFLGYRVAGNYALALGDPVGPAAELETTIQEFLRFCQKRGWRVGFHQVQSRLLPAYQSLGFRKLRIGNEAIVDLTRFSLAGSEMKEFRNTVTRLDRLGYRVERVDAPWTDAALLADLQRISESWLAIPGHRERQFTLGQFDAHYLRSTPVYVAFDASHRAVAFLNLVPSYDPKLATVDLMRRSRNTVNGLMDYLFAKAFLDLKQRGITRFSLGLAPLSKIQSQPASGADERVVEWTLGRLPFLFRADSLSRFKAKYADDWEPRYSVYQSRMDLPRLALALRRLSERPAAMRGAA